MILAFTGNTIQRYSPDQARASDGRFGEGEGHSGYAVERVGPHHVVMAPGGKYAGSIFNKEGRGPVSHTRDYSVKTHPTTQSAVDHLIAAHKAQDGMHDSIAKMQASVAQMKTALALGRS